MAQTAKQSGVPSDGQQRNEADYRRGDSMKQQALEDGYIGEKEAKRLEALQKKGVVGDRTVADYVTKQGANPYAVDQMGLDILVAFRRKMFALLLFQCAVVLVLAWGVANIPAVKDMKILYQKDNKNEFYRDCAICLALWVFSVIALCGVAAVRYKFPMNVVALSVFTVLISCTLAAMAGPNVHLGLAMVLIGLTVIAFFSCIKIKNKVLEVFPIAFVAMVICNIIIIVWMVNWGTFMNVGYVVVVMLLNSIGLCWAGYEIDRLCSRLKVDEYMLPVVLLWAELLVTMLLVFSLESMCDAAGECQGGCYMWGYTTWHCDCWIYSDGTYGKDKYRKKQAAENEKSDAPVQQNMGQAPAPAEGP